MIATVRHVSASGRLDHWWQYDPARRVLILRISLGSAPTVDLDELAVCSLRSPRRFAWIMNRVDETTWRLSPAKHGESTMGIPRATPFHEQLPVGSIDLVGAPGEVARELEEL